MMPGVASGGHGHGELSAGEVGEIVGVTGTTIGQWARRGLIRSSRSSGEPRVYAVEDVGEASVVFAMLAAGLPHAAVHRTIAALRDRGRWPLSAAELGVSRETRPRVVLCEERAPLVLVARGWQRLAPAPDFDPLRVRLQRAA